MAQQKEEKIFIFNDRYVAKNKEKIFIFNNRNLSKKQRYF